MIFIIRRVRVHYYQEMALQHRAVCYESSGADKDWKQLTLRNTVTGQTFA